MQKEADARMMIKRKHLGRMIERNGEWYIEISEAAFETEK